MARDYVPKQRLLFFLYALLWMTVADFLKVIREYTSYKAYVFYAASALLLLLMTISAFAPLQFATALKCVRGCAVGGVRDSGKPDISHQPLLRDAETLKCAGGAPEGVV